MSSLAISGSGAPHNKDLTDSKIPNFQQEDGIPFEENISLLLPNSEVAELLEEYFGKDKNKGDNKLNQPGNIPTDLKDLSFEELVMLKTVVTDLESMTKDFETDFQNFELKGLENLSERSGEFGGESQGNFSDMTVGIIINELSYIMAKLNLENRFLAKSARNLERQAAIDSKMAQADKIRHAAITELSFAVASAAISIGGARWSMKVSQKGIDADRASMPQKTKVADLDGPGGTPRKPNRQSPDEHAKTQDIKADNQKAKEKSKASKKEDAEQEERILSEQKKKDNLPGGAKGKDKNPDTDGAEADPRPDVQTGMGYYMMSQAISTGVQGAAGLFSASGTSGGKMLEAKQTELQAKEMVHTKQAEDQHEFYTNRLQDFKEALNLIKSVIQSKEQVMSTISRSMGA